MKNETTSTKTTAPIIDGTIAISATCGPQSPRIASPNEEPIRPAIMLVMQPMDLPRPVIAPAIAPITAPTINTHIQCINVPPCLSVHFCYFDTV